MRLSSLVAGSLVMVFLGLLPLQAWSATVVAEEGTPVQLILKESVSSGKSKEGDTIKLEIKQDVLGSDGESVVIAAGSPAWGTVREVNPRGRMGEKGDFTFTVDGTNAINGKKIPLRATISREGKSKLALSVVLSILVVPLFLLMRGKDARMNAGAPLSAYVDRDTKVEVTPLKAQPNTTDSAKPAVTPPQSATP